MTFFRKSWAGTSQQLEKNDLLIFFLFKILDGWGGLEKKRVLPVWKSGSK